MKFKKVNYIFATIIVSIITLSASADTITTINVKDIEAYSKSHSNDKPLILHLSSKDRGCGPCLIDNGAMSEAANSLSQHYNIAAVYFQPWASVGKNKELVKKYEIRGVPTTIIIHKDKVLAAQSGVIKNKTKIFNKFLKDKIKPKE